MQKIIAIDFDETITDCTPYPFVGNVREEAKKYIPLLYDKGYMLILWTCRYGDTLQKALDTLEDNHLLQYFTYINDDGLNRLSKKVVADFYIDDKSCMGEINWDEIYTYIINNIQP